MGALYPEIKFSNTIERYNKFGSDIQNVLDIQATIVPILDASNVIGSPIVNVISKIFFCC